jgi:hypothetical protein
MMVNTVLDLKPSYRVIIVNLNKYPDKRQNKGKEGIMGKPEDKCVTPAKGPISAKTGGQGTVVTQDVQQRRQIMTAKVGKAAPDFEASAFHSGGFRNIKLSDYKGKWVVVCFYPGDFTFV